MIGQPSVMKSAAMARKNVHASPLAPRPAKRVSGIVRFQDGPKERSGTGKKDLHAADVIHNLKNKNPLGVHTDSELAAAIDQHKSKAEVQSTDEWIRHIAVKPAPKPAKPAAHSRAEEQADVKGASSMVDAKGNLWEYKGVCGSTASMDDFEQEIEFKMPDASELAPAEQDRSDLPAGTVFQYPGTPCGSTVSVDEFDSELQFKEVDEQLKK